MCMDNAKLGITQTIAQVAGGRQRTLKDLGPAPVGSKDSHICNICHEHIWSFICNDCLAEDVGNLLLEDLDKFEDFHQEVKAAFSSEHIGYLRCMSCKEWKQAPICMYCYLGEVYHWLKGSYPELAEQVARMLPLQKGSEFSEVHGIRLKKEAKPLSDGDEPLERVEFGLCDVCGEYSDELVTRDSGWVCKSCE